MKAIEIPVLPSEGIDLAVLASALEKYPIKACWFMTTFQNPMGANMEEGKKRELVELLARYEVPLIEDDVHGELYFGNRQPLPAKAFDRKGLVMHCNSFSKTLAPGYRIGWVAPGRFGKEIERLKLMTTLSGSVPAQVAIADYLHTGSFDKHLRKLRHALEAQLASTNAALTRYFPSDIRVSRPVAVISCGWSFRKGSTPWRYTGRQHRSASASRLGRSFRLVDSFATAYGSTTAAHGATRTSREWSCWVAWSSHCSDSFD